MRQLDPGHCVVDPAGVVHIAEGKFAGYGNRNCRGRVDLGPGRDVDADPGLLSAHRSPEVSANPVNMLIDRIEILKIGNFISDGLKFHAIHATIRHQIFCNVPEFFEIINRLI